MMPFGKKLEQLREDVIKYIKWKLDEKSKWDFKGLNIQGDDFGILYVAKNNGPYYFVQIDPWDFPYPTEQPLEFLHTESLCAIADAIQFYGIETYKDQIENK